MIGKKVKFYSLDFGKEITGKIIKSNAKTLLIEIPKSYEYKLIKTSIPIKDKSLALFTSLFGSKLPYIITREKELVKKPTVIKKKISQVKFI